MKTKKASSGLPIPKLILVLPVILIMVVSMSSCAARKKTLSVHSEVAPPSPPPPPPAIALKANPQPIVKESISEEVPFVVVEVMPMYPGGDEALMKYIAENVKYPESSKNQKIEGRVIVRFCVKANGGVDRISILKGVAPELDAEALRVVGTLPEFKPGQQGGKDVPVWYMVPISFALK